MGLRIQINRLDFAYPGTDFRLAIEQLLVAAGESVALIGPSGSGKTTLLQLISGVRPTDKGRIVIDEVDITTFNESSRRIFRLQNMGLVFQEFELLEHLRVRDNILLPYRLSPNLKLNREVGRRAAELAQAVGMADKLGRYVGQLSQGERQRVAVCRALVTRPPLLLADEPTGNLDPANKQHVWDLLLDYKRQTGATLVTVTHDYDLMEHFDRAIDSREFHGATLVKPTQSGMA